MYTPLPLKYRPQTLAELVGQPMICLALSNAITKQQIASAYLFTGSRGTGKTSTARIFAKSLNCIQAQSPTVIPCGHCSSCREISNSVSLDVNEIDAASHNGVEDARELIQHSSFAPTTGRYRIFILDEAHMLTTASQNTLLKLIEEPPFRCIFILCTTEPHKLLPTISSRCQIFNFQSLGEETITTHLRKIAKGEKMKMSEEVLSAIAFSVNGGLRDSISLLDQLSLMGTVKAEDVYSLTGIVSKAVRTSLLHQLSQDATLALEQVDRLLAQGLSSQRLIEAVITAILENLETGEIPPHVATQASTQLHTYASTITRSQSPQLWLKVALLELSALLSSECSKATRSS